MDKRDIIDIFLKNGLMLSPEEAEAVDEKNYIQMLEKRLKETKKDEVVVEEPKTGRISCEEFIKIYSRKFEFLRGILLKKTDAVSINKGKKVFSELTIIGRVKDMTPRGFVIEDVTGETEVASDNNSIKTGDVLGLRGFFRENCFSPNQVIWPDIPLENSPRPVHIKITLAPRFREGMGGVVLCPSARKADNIISGFGRLGVIKISKHGRDLIVMAYSPSATLTEDEAVKMLKRRQIQEEGMVDDMIYEIPGILWLLNNGKNWTRNYRGVVIISTDADSFAEYDGDDVSFGSL